MASKIPDKVYPKPTHQAPLGGKSVGLGFDFKRLPGSVSWSSKAFWRKVTTQDARLAMADIIKKYEELIRKLKAEAPIACENALRPVFKKAQYYTPEKTGALWESGELYSGIDESGHPYARITFGNDEAWYAALVHEFTWLHHESPTRSKYLQAALEEELPNALDIAAKTLAGTI